MVNGKFRTPALLVFSHGRTPKIGSSLQPKADDNVNEWRNANIIKLPLDTSSIDSNGWLAGFADSDAHFAIRLSGKYRSDDS